MATLHSSRMPTSFWLYPALKSFVTASTLLIAGGMDATTFQFVPTLIAAAQKSSTSDASAASGRLTPQPTPQSESKGFNLTVPDGSGWPSANKTSSGGVDGHKIAAQQFTAASKTAFTSYVPLEVLGILTSGYLTYQYRSAPVSRHWQRWAVVTGLITAVFPLTGVLMGPLMLKIARIAGEEEKVEPYEDAPVDRAADRDNVVEFLKKWNTLNGIRTTMMLTAGLIGLYDLAM